MPLRNLKRTVNTLGHGELNRKELGKQHRVAGCWPPQSISLSGIHLGLIQSQSASIPSVVTAVGFIKLDRCA